MVSNPGGTAMETEDEDDNSIEENGYHDSNGGSSFIHEEPMDEDDDGDDGGGDHPESQQERQQNGDNQSDAEHKHGAIIRIELNNFMTYKHLEFFPGPFLNLILGPNGSGKSALVCAIILGFGGDPQITGRASNLIDYIRFGSESAFITIDIKNRKPGEADYQIQRVIRMTIKNGRKECHTSWLLNGKGITRNQLVDFTKSLKIDINNLCQILPQEKVIEFSQMSPRELLFSTEKSIGDVVMYDQHMKLIELSTKIIQLELKIKEANAFILKFQSNQTNIEGDLKALQQKKKFEEEINWLKKKKVWLEFEEKRMEFMEAKTECAKVKAEYQKFEEFVRPLKEKVDHMANSIFELKQEQSKLQSETIKMNTKLSSITDDIAKCQDDAKELVLGEQEIDSERRRLAKRLAQYEQDYENFRNDLVNHPKADEFDGQLEELATELKKIDVDIRNYISEVNANKNKLESANAEKRYHENRLKSINDLFGSRLEKAPDPEVKSAYEWLENNRHMFRGEIFPPLITQINVIRTDWVRYVEAVIGSKEMSTFLFEEISDLELFTSELKKQLNIRVNMALIPEPDKRPQFDIEPYRRYGIFARVSDLFNAPEKVMTYLNKNHFINHIPVGDLKTEQHINELIEKSQFKRILTPTHQYVIVLSPYDGEKSIRITALLPPKFLNIIIDEDEQKKAQETLATLNESIINSRATLSSLQKNYDKLLELRERKFGEHTTLENKKNAIAGLENKIRSKANQINQIKQDLQRVESQKGSLVPKLEKLQEKQMELLQTMVELCEKGTQTRELTLVVLAKIEILRQAKEEFDRVYAQMNVDGRCKREELQKSTERLNVVKQRAREYREKAKRESGFDFNENTDQAIKDKIYKLPATLAEIEDAIVMFSMRCQGIRHIDDAVIQEYQRYQKDIKEKTELCQKLEAELVEKKQMVDELKPVWIESLEKLIEKINHNFGKFMEYLNCCGQVYLYVGKKTYTFDDYGIGIKVKFRDSEPLKDLDACHQSGGERSVSTMLYMLSLQELAHVPFRVVDEINQGMDDNNERRVFDLISHVSQKNSSQYFLLSPKLLTNLNYSRDMKIHIIFNGSHTYVNFTKVIRNLLGDCQNQSV